MSFGRPYENRDVDAFVDAQVIRQERERIQARIDAVLEQRAPLEDQIFAVISRIRETAFEQPAPASVVEALAAQLELNDFHELYLRLASQKTPLDREYRQLLNRDIALLTQFNLVSSTI
jgi:hypothetical protein